MSYDLYVTAEVNSLGALSDGVAASSTNTYRSLPLLLGQDAGSLSLDIETTGDLTGTWTLWYSNKQNVDLTAASDADWVQDTTFSPTNPAAGVTHWFVSIGNVNARLVRLKYVNASGTGNIFARAESPRMR